MEKEWFEMRDIRRRKMSSFAWIPLRAVSTIEKNGKYGFVGYKDDFYGVGTIAVFESQRVNADELDWDSIGIIHEHYPSVEVDEYVSSDIYIGNNDEALGIHLVLEQSANSLENKEWHLHQDFVIALKLKREADVWVSPDEGYIEVARLSRDVDGSPFLFEVKAEYLKDYLCARKMALCATSYRMRDLIVEDAGALPWSTDVIEDDENGERWEGRVIEIHEGGDHFGATTAVFHVSRNDVDVEEDIPQFGFPTDENVDSSSYSYASSGRKLFRVIGDLWRKEWVEASKYSTRIKKDKIPSTVSFIVDNQGGRESELGLKNGSKWLWFKPEIMMTLINYRGGSLDWYTAQTGSVGCSPDYSVHFGINKLGLINVYAKDIAGLPEWQQRIWVGYNVSPDGGVSEELLSSQMKARPATTSAPEPFLVEGLKTLNIISTKKLRFLIIREHDSFQELLKLTHRFRAIDKNGLYALAKDIARLTADSIETSEIQKLVTPPKGEKWGSLKSLEKLLALKLQIEPLKARKMLSPLVGVYELRHGDAHLPSSGIDENFNLCGVNQSLPFIHQGHQMIAACVTSIFAIAKELDGFVEA